MLEPIFARCVRCNTSFNWYQRKNHTCPEKENA